MKLIDRYVREVGEILPDKIRPDIEKEIRSLIEDRLADRLEEEGQSQPTNEMVEEILAELGAPEVVAEGYLPEQYLISPRYYFIFNKVVRVVLFALAIALGVATVVRILVEGMDSGLTATLTGNIVLQMVWAFVQAAMSSFAIIVLIFAAVERSQQKADVRLKLWTPQALEEPEREKVSRAEKIAEIVFTVIAFVVFTAYREWLGISQPVDGAWLHAPILSDYFWNLFPLMVISWGFSLGLSIYLTVRGFWETWSRWADIAVKLFEMVVIFMLLSTGPLAVLDPNALAQFGWETETILTFHNRILPMINISAKIALGLALFGAGVEVIKKLLKRARGVPVVEIKA